MKLRPFLFAICIFCDSAPAIAQSMNHSNVDVSAGASVRLGYYGAAGKACSSEPPPKIDVVTPPKHGDISIRTGSLATNRLPSCPNLTLPVEIVFYSARPGYAGSDLVIFKVKSALGTESAWTYSIDVKQPSQIAPQFNRL